MKDKRKSFKRIGLVAAIILVVVLSATYIMFEDAFNYLFIKGFISYGVKKAQQKRIHLLCETDHRALLDSCREILKRVDRGELKPGLYDALGDSAPEADRFPKQILDLTPVYIYISENYRGQILVAMYGGLDHFGIYAYSEDFNEPSPYFDYGDRKLIDGLWYYDDGYDYPEYDKVIDELINKYSKKTK